MTPNTIFDGQQLRVLHFDHGCDKVMVTFDFRTLGKTDFGPINPSSAFAKAGFDQLMIKTAANDWFINDETIAMELLLGPLMVRYDRVHVLGYSMGGYGAVRFARSLRANWLVAVSPQFSIAPSLVPFDRRYQTEATDFDAELGQVPEQPSLQGLILTDPFIRPDLRHARMIQAHCPNVQLLRLGLGGHPATQVLRDAGRGGVVQRVAMGLVPAARAGIAHRATRRQSPRYFARLEKTTQARWPAVAAFAQTQCSLLAQNTANKGDRG